MSDSFGEEMIKTLRRLSKGKHKATLTKPPEHNEAKDRQGGKGRKRQAERTVPTKAGARDEIADAENTWDDDLDRIVAWVKTLDGDTPPFTLGNGATVVNPTKYLQSLAAEATKGRKSPRARFGVLQKDLRHLAAVLKMPGTATKGTVDV